MTEAPESAGDSGRGPARRRPGTPCWVSLMAHSMTTAQAFYGELFGWEFRPGPDRLRPYVRAVLAGRDVAGIGRLPPDLPLPVAWTPYLASDDVDLTAETVRRCGGTIGVGPLETGDAGRLAIGSDPSGAVFGLWQAPAHRGTDQGGGPGTPVWHELHTFETANVAKFYATLFDYGTERREPDAELGSGTGSGSESGPESRSRAESRSGSGSGSRSGSRTGASCDDHVTLSLAGRPVAALHGAGAELPRARGSHWLTYFAVADAYASLDRLTALGGRVLAPPRDTGRGRVATVTDPEGARFALLERGC
ncbi:VOC family protein [Streptomyces sp. NPDC085995]|uniref:VOC family protein n=1 Tax=Streptomyces sp. NPDC085995 TaxID=3154861 RepID=UPI00343623AC